MLLEFELLNRCLDWNFVRNVLLAALAALLVTGCASSLPSNQIQVTYKTEPPGAMLYGPDSVAWGVAPVARVYTFKQQVGAFTLDKVTAIWPSGAQFSQVFSGNRAAGSNGYLEGSLSRPMNALGLDVDLAHAAQLARGAQEKKNQESSDAATVMMLMNSMNQSNLSTRCTTIGISTVCR
jgi:hypothetical protein